jgi:hypothetical protein
MTNATTPNNEPSIENQFEEKFLSPLQLSERYDGQISKQTLANWRSTGDNGPTYLRAGNVIMYKLSQILAWEGRNMHRSTKQYRAT